MECLVHRELIPSRFSSYNLAVPSNFWVNFVKICILSELKVEGWTKHKYCKTFDLSHSIVKDSVPRINYKETSKKEFIEKYERPLKPVVVTNALDDWAAMRRWTLEVRYYMLLTACKVLFLLVCGGSRQRGALVQTWFKLQYPNIA